MKNVTLFLLVITSALFLFSCNNDDDSSTDPNAAINVVAGTYNLESFTVPTQEDLNEDGVLSANLVSENACYTNWKIELNPDRSFTRTEKTVEILDGSISCQTAVDSGTWDIQANNVKLLLLDGTELNSNYVYLNSNNSLTQTRQSQYPTEFEQTFVLSDAAVNLIFVKQ